MNKSIRWGVVGCGDVFEQKSGPSLRAAKRSQITGLMRRDASKLQHIAQAYNPAFTCTKAEVLIQHPDIDIVYIATPPSSHLPYVMQAAAAGKHVLVEKPMGLNAGESQTMIDVCAAADVHLFVSYYRRFWPHIVQIKQLLDAGEIGQPLQAFFDFSTPLESGPQGWRLQTEVNGGAFFVDMSTHRLDLLAYFFGAFQTTHGSFSAHPNRPNIELTVSGFIEFANSVQALFRSDFQSQRRADYFEIIGSSGRIIIDNIANHEFRLIKNESQLIQGKAIQCKPLTAPHLGLIEHIEAVIFDGAQNQSSGQDGLITDQIVDIVLKRR